MRNYWEDWHYTLAKLTIIVSIDNEITELETMKTTINKLWRKLAISIVIKTHMVEDHLVEQTKALQGTSGNKAELHV